MSDFLLKKTEISFYESFMDVSASKNPENVKLLKADQISIKSTLQKDAVRIIINDPASYLSIHLYMLKMFFLLKFISFKLTLFSRLMLRGFECSMKRQHSPYLPASNSHSGLHFNINE